MNQRNTNALIGNGWQYTVRKQLTDSWRWQIKQYRKVVAEGVEKEEVEAQRAVARALGPLMVDRSRESIARGVELRKIRDYEQGRQCLTMSVLWGLHKGKSAEQIVAEAASEEKLMWDITPEWFRKMRRLREPSEIVKHPLALRPDAAAKKMLDVYTKLGIVGDKAFARGKKLFGYWFEEPSKPDANGSMKFVYDTMQENGHAIS